MENRVAPFNSAFRELADAINEVRAEQLDPADILTHVAGCREMADIGNDMTLRDMRRLAPWLDEIARVMQAVERKDYEEGRQAILSC